MQLRDYQKAGIEEIIRAISEGHKRVLYVAGTGSGKSVVSSQLVKMSLESGRRLLFLVHLEPLIPQLARNLDRFGIDFGYIKAGFSEDRIAPCQLASVQTLANRDWWKEWLMGGELEPIIITDEAHTCAFFDIHKELFKAIAPEAIYIGFTATPKRLQGEQLGDYYTALVAAPTPSELQERGYLSTLKYYVPDARPDVSKLQIVGEDYEPSELKNACDTPELVEKIAQEYQRLSPNKRGIAFCVDVEHANNVANAFNAAGIPAACIDGGTNSEDRQVYYSSIRHKDLLVLTSCNVLSTGFDEPSIEVGMLLRPTQSEALHIQQLGRVMRISPDTGKEFGIILDQAGNTTRLGKPEDILSYSLPVSDSKKEKGVAPTKNCPVCDKENYTFTINCECGFHWTTYSEINDNDLVELRSEEGDEKTGAQLREEFRNMRKVAYINDMWIGTAEKEFAFKYRFSPLPEWYLGSIFGTQATNHQMNKFLKHLEISVKASNRDINWIVEEFEKEFGKALAKKSA